MLKAKIKPDEVTYQCLIDGYVTYNDLEKAKELFKNQFKIKKTKENRVSVIDCHSYSHGTAFVQILLYVETHKEPFYAITGKGKHSKHNVLDEMAKYILKKAHLLNGWTIERDPYNLGRLKFIISK